MDTLPEIKICIGYRLNGKDIDYFPSSCSELAKVEVVYEKVDGWQSTTEGVRSLDKLPPNAHKYIRIIEENLNVPGRKMSLCLTVDGGVKGSIIAPYFPWDNVTKENMLQSALYKNTVYFMIKTSLQRYYFYFLTIIPIRNVTVLFLPIAYYHCCQSVIELDMKEDLLFCYSQMDRRRSRSRECDCPLTIHGSQNVT